MLDGANGAAQFGEAAQPADRGIAGVGPLGLIEIVEHAVASSGADVAGVIRRVGKGALAPCPPLYA